MVKGLRSDARTIGGSMSAQRLADAARRYPSAHSPREFTAERNTRANFIAHCALERCPLPRSSTSTLTFFLPKRFASSLLAM